MTKASALARRGVGRTRPNPPVGAVVVRNGACVGQGYQHAAGRPHAEVLALRDAGDAAKNAVLYVTLEPCSTHGRTPPCTQAILAAGVGRVVVGSRDPNPRHRGRGIRHLRAAGVEVIEGIGREETDVLIRPFTKWVRDGVPWVTLKLAMSLDGRVADRRGQSRWISGPAARREVDRLRSEVDAILVGRGTAAADDPGLVPRNGRKPTARRVILDSRGRLPDGLRAYSDAHAALTVAALGPGAPRRRDAVLRGQGVTVWRLAGKQGRVSLKALMRRLGREGMLHVLCEGGGELAAALLAEGLVDEILVYTAPLMLGASGRPGVGGGGWLLQHAPRFTMAEVGTTGRDARVRLVRA